MEHIPQRCRRVYQVLAEASLPYRLGQPTPWLSYDQIVERTGRNSDMRKLRELRQILGDRLMERVVVSHDGIRYKQFKLRG